MTCRSEETGQHMLVAITCKTWQCKFCAGMKIKRLAFMTQAAKPNRFITLTVKVSNYESPVAAWQATRARVPELFRSLRPRFGDVEYLRVTELTKQGFPHYHCLVRSKYLPHPVIKAWWEAKTGNPIVDVRQVNSAFNAYWYLVKYLTKMHNLEWTERHVSYSRGFFPADMPDLPTSWKFVDKQPLPDSPHEILLQSFMGEQVIQMRPGLWALPHAPNTMDLLGPTIADRAAAAVAALAGPQTQRTLNLQGPTNVPT